MATLKSQREQIRDQRAFIAEQTDVLQLQRDELSASAEKRTREQAQAVRLNPQEDVRARWQARGIERVAEVRNESGAAVHDVNVLLGNHAAGGVAVRSFTGRWGPLQPPPVSRLGPFEVAAFCFFKALGDTAPHAFFTDDAERRWHVSAEGLLRPAHPGDGFPEPP
ncbi:hypothetical protein ABTX60_07190 [Streptomyces sp. NPDC126510]|uniref:hypothetical protein n=1 Tax=Streptomyces sp. NPDC126510 TaxID=3155317 RepID=UPI0033319E44